jgi:hypothetical protein
MTQQDRIVNMLNELLCIFDCNKPAFNVVLNWRHRFKNVLTDVEVSELCVNAYLNNAEYFVNHNAIALIGNDACLNLIWSFLSPSNRTIVWQWIDSIVESTHFT